MRLRALLIILVIIVTLVPFYYLNRWLQGIMRPREAAVRFFLFMFANFLLIIIYTVLIVGIVVRLFGR